MNRTFLSGVFFIFYACMFGQQDLPMDVFLSQNKKEYVILMPNNNFALIEYKGKAPHQVKPSKKPIRIE